MDDELEHGDEAQGEEGLESVTKMVIIGDREVLCRMLTEAQFMQLAYEANVLENKHTPNERKIKTLSRLFRVMRSVIVDEDDREYVEDLMADGSVTMKHILSAIKELNDTVAPANTAKVRRGVPARRR